MATNYVGSVYFTSTDTQATLPYTSTSKYTFTSGTGDDNGVHTFAGTGFTLKTAGSQTITVTTGTVSKTSNAITVNPGSATKLVFTVEPTSIVHNQRSTVFTVQLEDSYGNAVTAGSATTVTLTANAGSNGLFYATAISNTAITSVTIAQGSTSANFYYQIGTTGSKTITASSGTLTSAIATYTAT